MRRLTLWLSVALLTFIVSSLTTLCWYVRRSPDDVILASALDEQEVWNSQLEVPQRPFPFCELVKFPRIYEGKMVNVISMYPHKADELNFALNFYCAGEKKVVWVEYESEKVSAESEQLLDAINKRMDNCWVGSGMFVGRLESAKREGYGPQKDHPFRFVVLQMKNPDFVSFCGIS